MEDHVRIGFYDNNKLKKFYNILFSSLRKLLDKYPQIKDHKDL